MSLDKLETIKCYEFSENKWKKIFKSNGCGKDDHFHRSKSISSFQYHLDTRIPASISSNSILFIFVQRWNWWNKTLTSVLWANSCVACAVARNTLYIFNFRIIELLSSFQWFLCGDAITPYAEKCGILRLTFGSPFHLVDIRWSVIALLLLTSSTHRRTDPDFGFIQNKTSQKLFFL